MTDILPCPFCGKAVKLKHSVNTHGAYIRCVPCDFSFYADALPIGNNSFAMDEAEELVTTKWNTRAGVQKAKEPLASGVYNQTFAPCCVKHWRPSIFNRPMIVCRTCGNKRCPKASDCELECTNSNESGQEGSVY